ncbi:unnamed protein product, partial [Prorocentrum cordatum]
VLAREHHEAVRHVRGQQQHLPRSGVLRRGRLWRQGSREGPCSRGEGGGGVDAADVCRHLCPPREEHLPPRHQAGQLHGVGRSAGGRAQALRLRPGHLPAQ